MATTVFIAEIWSLLVFYSLSLPDAHPLRNETTSQKIILGPTQLVPLEPELIWYWRDTTYYLTHNLKSRGRPGLLSRDSSSLGHFLTGAVF